MGLQPTDISQHVGDECIAMCPLCDNEMLECEPVSLVVAHSAKMLAHTACVEYDLASPTTGKHEEQPLTADQLEARVLPRPEVTPCS